MLNDVLAVCVAAAVVVVFATIFGAVELLWKVLHAARAMTSETVMWFKQSGGKEKHADSLRQEQHALVEKVFAIVRDSSFGFREDRLWYIQREEHSMWTRACIQRLRQKIDTVTPKDTKVTLIYFDYRWDGCLSLQCQRMRPSS